MDFIRVIGIVLITVQYLAKSCNGVGPSCHSCSRIPYPRDCNNVIKCSDFERCAITQFVSESGVVLYDTGCMSSDSCLSKRSLIATAAAARSTIPGDIVTCIECCQGDYCNTQGCSAEPLPLRNARGPVCFECLQQSGADLCDRVTVCERQQKCYIRLMKYATGDHLYETGCERNNICSALNIPGTIIGKRMVQQQCLLCCDGDYCNNHCPEHFTTLTAAGRTHTTPIIPTKPMASAQHNPVKTTQHNLATPTQLESMLTSTHTVTTTPVTITSLSSLSTQATKPQANEEAICTHRGYIYLSIYNHCVKFYHTITKTWLEARLICKQDGGDLLVFRNLSEEKYFVNVTESLIKNYQFNYDLRFWVGATDLLKEGNWIWLDGTEVSNLFFHSGEPNDAGSPEGFHENCGAYEYLTTKQNILLNDENCTKPSHFVCEMQFNDSLQHTFPLPSSHATCRNTDYTYDNVTGICFKVYTEQKSQAAALRQCNQQNAQLLIIRDAKTENVFQHLSVYPDMDNNKRYWLGARRRDNHFYWLNGQELSTELEWDKGEPNNFQNSENCLTFTYFRWDEKSSQFALNDDNCDHQYYFICEEKCPDASYRYAPAFDLCFKINYTAVTWQEARDQCILEHADLLEPTSPDQFAYMKFILDSIKIHGALWVGANDTNRNNNYHWLVNKPVTIPRAFWHSTEPSNGTEHCVAFHLFPQDGLVLLNDLDCDRKEGFMCQYMW